MKRARGVQFHPIADVGQCYSTIRERRMEGLAVTLMQMASDGLLTVADGPRGPMFSLPASDAFVQRRFEIVA